GGMGLVVAATHLELGGLVALKFLLSEGDAPVRDDMAARFAREARAMFALKSEHAAHVLDVGRLEGGAPFMVMEYLEGTDLAAATEETSVPIGRAVSYVLQACRAIGEAHALGIVHRDIKLANLFLARRPDGTEL